MPSTLKLPSFLLLLGCVFLAACSSVPGTDQAEQAEDKVARAEYYETAAVTYYDGQRYDLAALQFRRVLGEEPNHKKAKRGLGKSLYMDAAGNAGLSRKERAARRPGQPPLRSADRPGARLPRARRSLRP
ncbi:MAG: hypothetical protein P1V36_09925 [Planctomycetota bacterium]|nr:hypothetical protein [Planctomycetota bacterium]